MTALLSLLAAASEPNDVLGLPVAIVAPIVAAVIAAAATRYSTLQSRAASHDQVVAQTAAVLKDDNQNLRNEIKEIRREAREARIEAHQTQVRVSQLEQVLRDAGVPVPPTPVL